MHDADCGEFLDKVKFRIPHFQLTILTTWTFLDPVRGLSQFLISKPSWRFSSFSDNMSSNVLTWNWYRRQFVLELEALAVDNSANFIYFLQIDFKITVFLHIWKLPSVSAASNWSLLIEEVERLELLRCLRILESCSFALLGLSCSFENLTMIFAPFTP